MKLSEIQQLEYNLLGIMTGIITPDEFFDFVDEKLIECDPIPDIYLDLFPAVGKGREACVSCIGEYFDDLRYYPSYSVWNGSDEIPRMLLKCIEKKYRARELAIWECCKLLTLLNDNSNIRADIYQLELICDYVCESVGSFSEKDIEEKLEEIFQQGIEI